MSDKQPQSGSAILIAMILLVLAAGAGVWFYLKKDIPASITEETAATIPSEQTQETFINDQVAANAMDEAPIAPAESAPVADLTAPTTSMPGAVDSGAVVTDGKVDVAKAMGPRGIGNPNAPIKIIEYASLTCSHCAHFHNDILPQLKSKYIDGGQVYMEFREFPLNDPALKATITARCLPANQYEGFVGLLFKNQEQWSTGIDYMAHLKQNAKLAGLTEEQFEACQNDPEIKNKIAENMQEAQDKWKVSATPTFIINDGAQTINGAQPLENFERIFREVSGGTVGEAPKVE